MKTALLPLTLIALAGCSQSESGPQTPGPTAGMTAQQNLEKIQNDPKIPDGLKKIQTDTLQNQPGVTH